MEILKKQNKVLFLLMKIDKVARMSENRSSLEMFREKVYNKLYLKSLKVATVNVPPKGGRKHPGQDAFKLILQIYYLFVVELLMV